MKPAKYLKGTSFLAARLFLLWIILFLPHLVSAQTDNQFWFVAPNINGEGRSFNIPIVLRLTAGASPATVTISIPANPSFTPIVSNISTDSTLTVDLSPWVGLLQNAPANTTLNCGLLINSTTDITAYYEVVSSYCNCDPEVFSLKGKNALGTEFFISSQYTYDESSAYAATNSFDIVATQNNTHVTITPTQNIIGHNANAPFTIVLNAGQTYSAVATSSTAGGHLQGSYISSDNPIAVTLKDDLVQVSTCADLIGDQTVPTSVIGTEYIVTKGLLQPTDEIYVLATMDGTNVYVDGNGTPAAVLSKGQSVTFNLSNPSTYIRANQNIYVYQLTGSGCEVGSAIIPKLNCTGSQSVSIVRSDGDIFSVLLTTKNGDQGNFTVNGNAATVSSSNFAAVPGTGGAYVTSLIDLSGAFPVGSVLNFTNSAGKFSLGFLAGLTNEGTSYGFFSDFKSSNVESNSVQVCQSGSAQLLAYGGATYMWSPAAGLSNPNIANPLASPAATTDYKVIITTADGCVDSAKVHVTVVGVKTADTTVTICSGGNYTLPSGKIVSAAGTYNDTISYKAGCDSLVTTLHLQLTGVLPSVSIAASGNNICAGTPITFTATPNNGGSRPVYQWLVNGNNAGTNSGTFVSSDLANADIVSCQLTSNAPCAAPAIATSDSIAMVVYPVPVVDGGGNKIINQGSSVKLNATASGNIAEITWSPATGLDNPNTLTPNASPDNSTLYTLTVQSTDGCVGKDSVKVAVIASLTIPNTFTPNGDGVNDTWNIKNLSDYPAASIQIFNRWGQQVYNSIGYSKPWDGTLNGKRLAMGTYYYVINLNNNTRPIGGFVLIIR
jgi:gliding motility-associated-like protein